MLFLKVMFVAGSTAFNPLRRCTLPGHDCCVTMLFVFTEYSFYKLLCMDLNTDSPEVAGDFHAAAAWSGTLSCSKFQVLCFRSRSSVKPLSCTGMQMCNVVLS